MNGDSRQPSIAIATFRFHGDLNDFLAREQRERPVVYAVDDGPAVKHPIEALGVPHPEVAAILINGAAVPFSQRVSADDLVDVLPASLAAGVAGAGLLQPTLSPPLRFVCDTHLGQLASYLRMLGFDTLYDNGWDDPTLAEIAATQVRVLLTRDRGLLKRKIVVHGHCLRSMDPRQQLIAVLHRYQLRPELRPWSRCLRCNGALAPVSKASILDQLEPRTKLYYDEFERCGKCGQVYWQGSHHARMEEFVAAIVAEDAATPAAD